MALRKQEEHKPNMQKPKSNENKPVMNEWSGDHRSVSFECASRNNGVMSRAVRSNGWKWNCDPSRSCVSVSSNGSDLSLSFGRVPLLESCRAYVNFFSSRICDFGRLLRPWWWLSNFYYWKGSLFELKGSSGFNLAYFHSGILFGVVEVCGCINSRTISFCSLWPCSSLATHQRLRCIKLMTTACLKDSFHCIWVP